MSERRDENGAEENRASAGAKGKRGWTPSRQRNVKSKKSLDQAKMNHLVSDEGSIYRGELDPRKKDPDRKPRSISRSEEKIRARAEAIAEEHPLPETQAPQRVTNFRKQFEECKASPGRLGALYATREVRRRGAFANQIIESTIDKSKLNPADKAFATLLTLGVVSSSGSLDEIVNRCLRSPRDIKPDVRDALRISAYEIMYLRKSPHAAVDQGVELVRAVAPSAAGLGNAVLHRLLDLSESFPFGDPSKSLEALALTCAFPLWLARLLVEDLGPQAAAELMRASNEPAPLYLYVNPLMATDFEVTRLFEDMHTEALPGSSAGIEPPGCFRITNARTLNDGRVSRLFQQGKILVSDASAQAVASAVLEDGLPGSLLEVGSGRGTKTIMLQGDAYRAFGAQTRLTCMDMHAFKSDLLAQRARDYGIKINDIVTGNAARLDSVMPDRRFKRIFIDAPCSGLGTLRRHHEIRWRLTPERIGELADAGLSLLQSAANHVEEGGEIIYATCTVTYAENNGVVKRFLESDQGSRFKLAPIEGKSCFASKLSAGSPDAHFAAKFVRTS